MNVSFQGKSYAVTRTTKSILDLKIYLSQKTHVPITDLEIYKKNKLLPDEYKLDSTEKEKEITLECKINENQPENSNQDIISYHVDPEKVKFLTNMGFTSRQATAALNITKGDADKAIFILKQTATPKLVSSPPPKKKKSESKRKEKETPKTTRKRGRNKKNQQEITKKEEESEDEKSTEYENSSENSSDAEKQSSAFTPAQSSEPDSPEVSAAPTESDPPEDAPAEDSESEQEVAEIESQDEKKFPGPNKKVPPQIKKMDKDPSNLYNDQSADLPKDAFLDVSALIKKFFEAKGKWDETASSFPAFTKGYLNYVLYIMLLRIRQMYTNFTSKAFTNRQTRIILERYHSGYSFRYIGDLIKIENTRSIEQRRRKIQKSLEDNTFLHYFIHQYPNCDEYKNDKIEYDEDGLPMYVSTLIQRYDIHKAFLFQRSKKNAKKNPNANKDFSDNEAFVIKERNEAPKTRGSSVIWSIEDDNALLKLYAENIDSDNIYKVLTPHFRTLIAQNIRKHTIDLMERIKTGEKIKGLRVPEVLTERFKVEESKPDMKMFNVIDLVKSFVNNQGDLNKTHEEFDFLTKGYIMYVVFSISLRLPTNRITKNRFTDRETKLLLEKKFDEELEVEQIANYFKYKGPMVLQKRLEDILDQLLDLAPLRDFAEKAKPPEVLEAAAYDSKFLPNYLQDMINEYLNPEGSNTNEGEEDGQTKQRKTKKNEPIKLEYEEEEDNEPIREIINSISDLIRALVN